jgi:hypothetical protein
VRLITANAFAAADRAGCDPEIFGIKRLSGIKRGEIIGDMPGQREIGVTDALDDSASEFIGAVVVVVGDIFAAGAKGEWGTVRTERFVERDADSFEIDERDFFFGDDFAHGLRIISMRVLDLAGRVKVAALHRGDEHWRDVAQSGFGDQRAEISFIRSVRFNVGLRPLFL